MAAGVFNGRAEPGGRRGPVPEPGAGGQGQGGALMDKHERALTNCTLSHESIHGLREGP